jgi:hypothetical protein
MPAAANSFYAPIPLANTLANLIPGNSTTPFSSHSPPLTLSIHPAFLPFLSQPIRLQAAIWPVVNKIAFLTYKLAHFLSSFLAFLYKNPSKWDSS